jgi:hypothetical protein
MTDEQKERAREKNRERKRLKRATTSTDNAKCFTSPQSLGKAIARVERTLPSNPSTRVAVIQHLHLKYIIPSSSSAQIEVATPESTKYRVVVDFSPEMTYLDKHLEEKTFHKTEYPKKGYKHATCCSFFARLSEFFRLFILTLRSLLASSAPYALFCQETQRDATQHLCLCVSRKHFIAYGGHSNSVS